jgi:dTDP-glucose 4,6-dehydratase
MGHKNILITGGAGFIGSHVVRHFVNSYPDCRIINLDKLTYAGNLENLLDIEERSNYFFEKADIVDFDRINSIINQYSITGIIHLAAESHVDRSISNPISFIETNVVGTMNLLNAAKANWKNFDDKLFYQVSTDEVYGSLGAEGYFVEETAYDPRSPYSASKASADHLVRAYFHTYGMPVVLSNCSNNYGPNQFPEKLIPLMINNIVHQKELPVYGDGMNIRDWLFVQDHVEAIDAVFHKGRLGETYNIGGDNELTNMDMVHQLCDLTDKALERPVGQSRKLIKFVKDRPGHDRRYAIDASKIKKELNWKPKTNGKEGLEKTIEWYLHNEEWMKHVTSGEYLRYYQKQYAE